VATGQAYRHFGYTPPIRGADGAGGDGQQPTLF
jgi:hypothetical protein